MMHVVTAALRRVTLLDNVRLGAREAMTVAIASSLMRTAAGHRYHQQARQPSRTRSMMAQASRRIYVKGDPELGKLGDCPFCHRALLTLEIKVCS